MKTNLVAAFLIIISPNLMAQVWSGTASGNLYFNSGKVGIGTSNPANGTLELYSLSDAPLLFARQGKNAGGSSTAFYFLDDRGYSGINSGTTLKVESWSTQPSAGALADFITLSNGVPVHRLHINNASGNIGVGHNQPRTAVDVLSSTLYPRISVQTLNGDGAPGFELRDNAGNPKFTWHYNNAEGFTGFYQEGLGNRMVITSNGNVLVGKTTQANNAYKLDVNGSIRSNEIVVNTNGADFVFHEGYKLSDLKDVEKFIKENKHLPEIKPATEMREEGLNVGEMEIKLLQKIEELTLYMIDFQKEMDKMKEENKKLREEIGSLKKE